MLTPMEELLLLMPKKALSLLPLPHYPLFYAQYF